MSPKRGAGARVGVGILRGRGILSIEIERFQSLSVSWFLRFLGFLHFFVSWCLRFNVPKFQKVHFMLGGGNLDPILPDVHSWFLKDIDTMLPSFQFMFLRRA